MLGALIATRAPFFSLSLLPAALFAVQVALFATGPETLAPEKRKPFSLKSANAFGSIKLLFTNGLGAEGTFSAHFLGKNTTVCQDRLGTHTGNERRFCIAGLRRLVLASGLFQGCTSNWYA